MKKIILNFFDEEISINKPKTLSDLRIQISLSFRLNLEDTKELLLSYMDNNSKKSSIENENDYKTFLSKKIQKINININQYSKIFKNEILKQEEENIINKKRLKELLELDIELEKPTPGKFQKEEDEIKIIDEQLKKLNEQLKKLKNRKAELVKFIHKSVNEKNIKHMKIRREIADLQEKLDIPPKYKFVTRLGPPALIAKEKEQKEKEKKIRNVMNKLIILKNSKGENSKKNTINISTSKPLKEKENNIKNNEKEILNKDLIIGKNEDEKKIHLGHICEGCNSSIIGIRYKCAVCNNFDYCEKCEKKFGLKHGHPMLKIKRPEEAPIHFKCILLQNNKLLKGSKDY